MDGRPPSSPSRCPRNRRNIDSTGVLALLAELDFGERTLLGSTHLALRIPLINISSTTVQRKPCSDPPRKLTGACRRCVGPGPGCCRTVRGKHCVSQQTLRTTVLLVLAEHRDSEMFARFFRRSGVCG